MAVCSVTCDNLVTSNFSAELVNGIHLDTIVLRSGNYTIEGNIEALDIVHPFNLAVDRISGYDMTSLEDRIFQKNYSNHQVITAKNLYANLEMEDMKVQGHLNGVGTSELIINDRNLAYHVNLLVFSDLEVEKINVWGDFDEMIKDGKHEFLLRHGHQILEGPKNIGHLHLMNDGQWVTPEIEQVEEIYDEYYTVRDGEQNTLMRQRDLDLCRSMTPDYGEGWLLETLESIGKDVKNIEDLGSGCTSNDIQCIQFSSGGELNLELQPNNYIKCLLNEMAVEESLKRDLLEKNVIDLSKREHLGTVSRTLLDLAYRIWLRYLDLVSESGCSYIPKSLNLGYLELCMDVKSWHEQELRNYEKFVDHMEDLVVIYKVKLSNPILADTKSNTNDHEEIIQTVGDLAKALQIELRCVIEDWNNTDVKNTSSLTPDGNIAQILLEHWTEKLEAHRYGLRKTINETTGAIMNYASCNPVHDHITFLQRFVTDLVSGVAEDEGPRKRRSLTVLANLQKSLLNSTATEDGTTTEVIGQVSEIEEALVNLKKNISRKLEQLMPDGLEYISKEDCEIFVDVSTLEDLQEDIVRLSASARPECERSSFAKVVADGAEVGKMLCSIVSQMMGEIYIIDQILAEAAPQSHSISRREILNVTMEELQETAIVQLQEPTLRPRSSIMMRARRSLGSKRQTLKNRKRHRESSPQQETTDEQRIPLMDVRPRSASSDHLGDQQVEPVSSIEQDSSSTSSAQPDREQIIALAMKIKKSKALTTIWEIDCNGRERGKREATMVQIMNYLNRTLPKLIKYADMIIEDASRVVDNFSWYYIQRLAEHAKTINIIIAQTSFTFIDQIDDLKELCRRVPKTVESLQEYQNLLQAQLLYSGALLYRRLPRPVAGGSTVSEKISGVNITALWGHLVASIPDGDNVSAFILTNGINLANVYCLDELRVDGTLNNVNVNDIRENALRLNETFIYPELIFEIPVVVEGNLQIHSIDGKKVEFCGLESNVTFGMDVEATNLELLSDATVEKTVNGIDLDLEMERVAILQPGSSRTSNNFTRSVTFEYLDAEEVISSSTTLGGKDLDEVVLVNKNATVEGPVLVSNLTCLDSLSVGTMEATLVDGANPSEVLGDSLLAYSEDPQTVKGPLWVDQLRVKKNVTTMNGIQPMQGNGTLDLWSLKESVVYIDGELAELDSLTIEGNVTIRNIQCSSAFDGVSCRAFKGDWLLNMTEQDLFASSVEGLDVEDLEVAPGLTVGSINFLEFFDHCVKIDDNTTLPSPVHFENVMSLGSVDVAGTFDSLNLDEVALEYTPGGNIALGGRKTFANDFEFTGNFSVLGEVNGRDMRKVCSGKLDKLVIDGDAFFNDIKVNYVKTKNFIFPSESTSHFWMRNKEAVVKFPVEFDGLVVKNTTVTGQFNSEDLENLHNTVIYRSCPDDQVPRVVTANWTVQNLQASELVTSDLQVDTVNGFRVDVDDVMVTGRDQVITGNHEYEQLEVSGSVTSDRVQELDGTFVDFDAMCVDGRSCDVTAPKAFGTLVVDNLFGGTVNGIEFSEFAQAVVRRSSGGTVQGTTYFNESLTAPSLSVLGSINGEVIKPDMYFDKVSDQVIRGQLTIGRTQASDTVANFQDVMTEDLKYCGVNLNDLLHRTVNLLDPTVITGKVNFSSGVVFNNVTYKFLETMKLVREQPDQAEVMEDGYEGLRSKALMMKSSLESQPTEFMGWLKTQTYFDNYYKIIPLKGTDTLVPLKNVPFNSISILSSSSTSSSHWDTFTPPALFSNPSVDGVVLPTVRYLALLPWQRNFEVLRFDEEKRRFFGVEGWHFEGNCSTGVAGYRHGTHNYVASINTCPTPYTVDNASVVLRPYGANQSMEELAFVSEMAFNSTPRVHAVIATESGSDLQVVMLRGRPCLIVSQYSSLGCFVVCHGDTNSYDLSVVQLISLPYVTKISIVEHEWKTGTKDLFILMASTPQTTDHGTVHLLKYVVKDDWFYEIEVLREKKIVSVAGVSFQGEVLVAVAKAFMYNHHGGIAIHKLDENSRLKLVQILKEEYPWDVAFSPAPDGSLHLYVTNKMGAIMTYTKKGLGRFLKRREMHLEGAVSVVPFISYTDRGDGRPHPGHYLVAGGLPDRNDLSSWSGVSSVLLEGKYKGKNYEGRSPVPEIHPEF
ncbi:uncharacterized protein LOC143037034 [Oratosquilla oratoria]|uniref:uncharacterized protein LOC143037034 n=1 Tax=Oratosquilla oratoria TaxID=337810 RepID=UPI003F76385B